MLVHSRSARAALAAAIVGVVAIANAARADISLSDGNANVTVQTSSSTGLSNWTVDGISQIAQQWFWYRAGSSGGEHAINTITGGSPTSEGSFGNFGQVVYSGGGLKVTVSFILTGGSTGSGTADVAETVKFEAANSLLNTLHIFQYADFNLGGTANDDSISFLANNSVLQTDGSGVSVSETGVVPSTGSGVTLSHQAGLASALLGSLNDGSPTTLNNTPIGQAVGPGDVGWAFQWDVTGANGAFILSKDMHIQIPAPGAALLGWLGIGLIGWVKRRAA